MTPMMKLINALNTLIAALQEIAGEETKAELSTFENIYTPPELEEPSAQPTEEKTSAETQKAEVTHDDVRAALAEKSRLGFKNEVKALMKKYGADKVSALPQDKCAEILKEAEKIGS